MVANLSLDVIRFVFEFENAARLVFSKIPVFIKQRFHEQPQFARGLRCNFHVFLNRGYRRAAEQSGKDWIISH